MTQLLSLVDEVIRYSDSRSRDRQTAHIYDMLLDIRNQVRHLENSYENILQQNEKLREACKCKED